ncbi:hypothetical protein V6N12_053560 [Hibiscus sabdariffa]|uniref:Uncharacterized protein n=1 Tax=Hibiscus sabdariffa TaxID=183260 RepID=A0ABR2D7Y5_9ROSI
MSQVKSQKGSRSNEVNIIQAKVTTNPETIGKEMVKSTLELWDNNTLAPIPSTLVESANEEKDSTKEDYIYADLMATNEDHGSADLMAANDPSLSDTTMRRHMHGFTRDTIKGNVGKGEISQANENKSLGTHLADSLHLMHVSTSRKRKALAIQNVDEACFLPKRREVLDAVNEDIIQIGPGNWGDIRKLCSHCAGCWTCCYSHATALCFQEAELQSHAHPCISMILGQNPDVVAKAFKVVISLQLSGFRVCFNDPLNRVIDHICLLLHLVVVPLEILMFFDISLNHPTYSAKYCQPYLIKQFKLMMMERQALRLLNKIIKQFKVMVEAVLPFL